MLGDITGGDMRTSAQVSMLAERKKRRVSVCIPLSKSNLRKQLMFGNIAIESFGKSGEKLRVLELKRLMQYGNSKCKGVGGGFGLTLELPLFFHQIIESPDDLIWQWLV